MVTNLEEATLNMASMPMDYMFSLIYFTASLTV